MKKKFLLAVVMVLVLILACGLAACNKNKDKGKQPSTPDTPTACEHEYGEWIVDTEATCTTNGAKHKTCTKCGDRVDEVITATGHVFDQEVVDAKYFASEATCTDKAKYYKSCTCGEKGTATFETGAALGHNLDAITGVCSRCSNDLGRTVTFDDEIFGNWYIHFAPVGNKIFFNFTTIEPEYYFYIDLEAQQYFYGGIKEEDLDSCLVKDVKLYKDGDFDNEIELADYDCVGSSYFSWKSEDYLDADTKYYVVITLDQEYDDFIFYFDSIDKDYDDLMNLNITTTAGYKIYDGNPFVVEATADEGEVSVIYFDKAVDYGTGTLTPPTEPGDYYAVIYAETETKYSRRTHNFSIFDIIEIEDVTVDNFVTLAPHGSQIFKVSTEDAPYLNFNLYDVFDEELDDFKFYISCFDPDMGLVDDGHTLNENFVIFPDLTYDYYYVEVYSRNGKETQQFNFKSLPIVADELTIGTPYIDDTNDDAEAGTWFITKAYFEKDKHYIIRIGGFHTEIYGETLQYIDGFEDITEYTPEKDGWIYLFSYKLLDVSYPFTASIEEPVV